MSLTRDGVFDRVFVDYLNRGGARISWTLYYGYTTPGPHVFQLQTGSTGNSGATDWTDVGPPAEDAYYAIDDVERTTGMHPTVFYRVVMTDLSGTHISRPVSVDGTLETRDWVLCREILRKEMLVMRKYNGVHGWLLKRKRVGPIAQSTDPRVSATDPWTGEVVTSHPDAGAFGTDKPGGYFAPIPFRVFMDPSAVYEQVDPSRGNVDEAAMVNEGRVILIPPLDTYDAFVEHESDYRYYIHLTQQKAHMRGVPLIADCKLHRAPVSDPIYDVTVPTTWYEPDW